MRLSTDYELWDNRRVPICNLVNAFFSLFYRTRRADEEKTDKNMKKHVKNMFSFVFLIGRLAA
jgi:hypothetical protein